MKLDKILVPLDGSSLAEAALPKAVELAESTGARLILLRAAPARPLPGTDSTKAQTRAMREARAYLAQVTGRLAAMGLTAEPSVWSGAAAHAIVDGARAHNADLIVMTTHGRSGLGRLILGSVAESVVRGTTIPILLIRAAEAPVEPPKDKGEAIPWPEIKPV